MADTFTEVVWTVNAGEPEKRFHWVGIASEFLPGLVVHEEIPATLDDDAEYAVSHLPTGYRVPSDSLGALSLAEALTLAVSLAALTDWSKLRTVDDVLTWCKAHRDELRTLLRTAPEEDEVEDATPWSTCRQHVNRDGCLTEERRNDDHEKKTTQAAADEPDSDRDPRRVARVAALGAVALDVEREGGEVRQATTPGERQERQE